MLATVLEITYPTLYPFLQGSSSLGGSITGGGHPGGSGNFFPLGS